MSIWIEVYLRCSQWCLVYSYSLSLCVCMYNNQNRMETSSGSAVCIVPYYCVLLVLLFVLSWFWYGIFRTTVATSSSSRFLWNRWCCGKNSGVVCVCVCVCVGGTSFCPCCSWCCCCRHQLMSKSDTRIIISIIISIISQWQLCTNITHSCIIIIISIIILVLILVVLVYESLLYLLFRVRIVPTVTMTTTER